MTPPTRADAQALDAADPLAPLREQFLVPDQRLVYLDGNSLGRPTLAGLAALRRASEQEWGEQLIRSWSQTEDGWLRLPSEVGDLIGTRLLGARPGEVVVADSTTINLARLVRAAVRARPGRSVLVTESDTFPTDGYVVAEIAAEYGLTVRTVTSDLDTGLELAELVAALDGSVAVACLSHVGYRSGAVLDLAAATGAAHAVGALTVWDLSHSAGALEIDLRASGVDLAVGCTYKYLNGGPGSPAFLYVRRELLAGLDVPLWGWFGQQEQFEMQPQWRRRDDIGGLLLGTPPVLALRCLQAAAGVLADAGLARLRAKSLALGELAVRLADAWLLPQGFTLACPRDADRRGGHVTLAHPRARELTAQLAAEGIVGDFRTPERIRLGLAPATTRYTDVWDAADALRRLTSPDQRRHDGAGAAG